VHSLPQAPILSAPEPIFAKIEIKGENAINKRNFTHNEIITYEQVSSASSAKGSLNIPSTIGREVVVSFTTTLRGHYLREGGIDYRGPVEGI